MEHRRGGGNGREGAEDRDGAYERRVKGQGGDIGEVAETAGRGHRRGAEDREGT